MTDPVSVRKLREFDRRIARLEDERVEINDQLRDVRAAAKAAGFSLASLAEARRRRKLDRQVRDQADLYEEGLG